VGARRIGEEMPAEEAPQRLLNQHKQLISFKFKFQKWGMTKNRAADLGGCGVGGARWKSAGGES
jgi:hypothetical protein